MLLWTTAVAIAAPVPTDSLINSPDRAWQLEPVAELGFLAPLSHTYQAGQDGTEFDYIAEGGQDNLFRVGRLSLDMRLAERHTVTFLYQPLDLRTSQVVHRDVTFDAVTFTDGTPIEARYGFDFYRASYTRDVLADPDRELGLGLSLQIRNAAIEFNLKPNEIRYVAFDENSQGSWGAAKGDSLPVDAYGGYSCTWGEFDFGSSKNNGWSGWDASIIQAEAALAAKALNQPEILGMKICAADGSNCSIIGSGGDIIKDAYAFADRWIDGIGGKVPSGPVRVVAHLDYDA